jgi:ATP-dependent RNA circularization protein (DNA/RNA ligase family)
MRGQTKNAAQETTVARLRAKGWRESDMFAKHVPMYYDRPYTGLPRPHVVSVDRNGHVYRGYPRSGR